MSQQAVLQKIARLETDIAAHHQEAQSRHEETLRYRAVIEKKIDVLGEKVDFLRPQLASLPCEARLANCRALMDTIDKKVDANAKLTQGSYMFTGGMMITMIGMAIAHFMGKL